MTYAGVRNCSGDTPGVPELVGDPCEGSELVGKPSRRSGSGRETLPEIWKC